MLYIEGMIPGTWEGLQISTEGVTSCDLLESHFDNSEEPEVVSSSFLMTVALLEQVLEYYHIDEPHHT